MNTRSIYFRLILWYSGLVVIVFIGFGAYTYKGLENRLYSEMEHTFNRRAHQIADNILAQANGKSPEDIARQIRAVYSPAANNRFIRVLKHDRSVLFVSVLPKDGLFNPATIALPENFKSGSRLEPLIDHDSLYVVSVPVVANGESFLVEMGAPVSELEPVLHGLLVILLLGIPAAVLVVSAGGYMLVRNSLKPVEDIRATAEHITFGNLSNRLPVVATGDELEHLSLTLNQMLTRLDDAYQQVSRFSADASHELRTPLSIMRGELETIIQRESGLPENLRERIGSVLEETEHMSHIVESLFAISRLDAGEDRTEPVVFNLAELVSTTKEQMLLMAEEKKITITTDANTAVKVKGNTARLKQVVVNLLDNAIKYTPEGGSISIAIYSAQHKAILQINDTGIGIPADALPHVFERFYRADKIRSREQGGAGLGLSIVRSICQAHGGNIEITSMENKGTTCSATFPLAI